MPPKLTPEEKKALAAQKKAAKKLKQIETKKQRQRDVLSREINYSNLTYQRHEKEWRKMLINVALPDMKKELEFAWHNFERVIDCKDFSISLLMDEIRDAEEQYMVNCKNHMEHIDQMIALFDERMQELRDDNDKEIEEIRIKHENQSEDNKQYFSEEESYLKTILYMLEVAKKDYKQTVRAEYFSKLEEEDTKNAQEIQKLRGILETIDYTVHSNIREFLNNYNNQVKDRKKHYEGMSTRDDAMQKILSHQLEMIRKAYENIKRLRQKFSDSQKLLGRKYKDLEVEYEFFNSAFNTLKRRLIADRNLDAKKIKVLSVNYNDSIQTLEKIEEKGEQILHVAAVCRKLETQDEKIRPFPIVAAREGHKLNMDHYKEYNDCLELFSQRVGQADASRFALNEERAFLRTENDILQMKLYSYCYQCPQEYLVSGISKNVTEGAIEQKKYAKQDYTDQFPSRNTISDGDYDDY